MEEVLEKESKKMLGKRFWSILMLVVASLLVVGMVLCYFIPKSFAPAINTPAYVKVYSPNSDGVVYNKDSNEYNKIMALYKGSFKVTIMDAMLNGKLSASGDYVEKYQSNPKSLESYAIELCYDDEQTIKDYNGSYSTYLSIVITVTNTTDLSEVKVYYMNTTSSSRVNYTTSAHQSALYDYLSNL